jgi:hypothetical protein
LRVCTDKFIRISPYLERHPDWTEFLWLYSGGGIFPTSDRDHILLGLVGFDHTAGDSLEEEVPPGLAEGFCSFASAQVALAERESRSDLPSFDYVAFAFDATGKSKSGVYYKYTNYRNEAPDGEWSPVMYYCDSFLDWLAEVVACGGKATDLRAKWLP